MVAVGKLKGDEVPGTKAGEGESPRSKRLIPQSKRGKETRDSLLRAAREIFERDGYVGARVTDIRKSAGVAAGSFYTYFGSKEEVLLALSELNITRADVHITGAEAGGDIIDAIESTNRVYFTAYRENAALMSIFEQVAQVDSTVRDMQKKRALSFTRRNERAIRRMQEAGSVDPSLDAEALAIALGGMTSRMAYSVFVLGLDLPFETMVETTTRIWTSALGLLAEAPDETVRAKSMNPTAEKTGNGTVARQARPENQSSKRGIR